MRYWISNLPCLGLCLFLLLFLILGNSAAFAETTGNATVSPSDFIPTDAEHIKADAKTDEKKADTAKTESKVDAKKEAPKEDKKESALLPDKFGIGGQVAFGLTTNFKNSNGDFPVNGIRRFFTNSMYGTRNDITADVGSDRLNKAEGEDLGLDFYIDIKPQNVNKPKDIYLKALASLNFETSKLGTMFSSGTNTNRFYMRDVFIQAGNLFVPDLTFWIGDRKRAGLAMFATKYRPSQDDVRMRGFGVDYFLFHKFMLSLDFGFHWLVKTTETINLELAEEGKVTEQYVGYVPLDTSGNPLTYDYFLFIGESNDERIRKIQTMRAKFEMPMGGNGYENAKMVIGGYGVYEWVMPSPGNKMITNRYDSNYGNWLVPKDSDDGLEFPADWGIKAGIELKMQLQKGMRLHIGAGYSAGISTLPIGPSRDYLLALSQDASANKTVAEREFSNANSKRLDQQRATTIGVGFDMTTQLFNIQAEFDTKLGSFMGNGEDLLKNLSANRYGQAEGTFILGNVRYTHFINDIFKAAVDLSAEYHFLSESEILNYANVWTNAGDNIWIDEDKDKTVDNIESAHKLGYIYRAYLMPGISLDGKNVDGNSIYAQFGLSIFNRTVQIQEGWGSDESNRIQWYMGLQGKFIF